MDTCRQDKEGEFQVNKRFLLMGAAAVLVMATVVGSALGAGQASSEKPVVADLKAADFSIEWSSSHP